MVFSVEIAFSIVSRANRSAPFTFILQPNEPLNCCIFGSYNNQHSILICIFAKAQYYVQTFAPFGLCGLPKNPLVVSFIRKRKKF
jgi:hypothetical protein